MSSWKNASKAHQRTHRERHQPAERQHLGLLQKRKDYRKRAAEHHEKQATLKALRKRALNRNADEFYHHMINSKVQDGVHHEVEKPLEDADSVAQARLMHTQDLRYIGMKRTAETNKLRRLQAELHLVDAAEQVPNQHVFFVDSKKEAKKFDLAARLDTHPDLVGRRSNRPRLTQLKSKKLTKLDEEQIKAMAAEKVKRYRELDKRVERELELTVVEQKLLVKRNLLNSQKDSKPTKMSAGTNKTAPVYKWRYERKR